MTDVLDDAEDAAREARDSRPVEALARLGLASRGVVWLVLSALAFSIVLGDSSQADQGGALKTLRDTPVGGPLLVVLATGFVGHAAWLLLCAAVGRRREKTWLRRGKDLAKSAVYLAVGGSTFAFLFRDSDGASATSRTAEAMSHPGGRGAVGLVGLVLLGVGLYLFVKGVTGRHAECLADYRVPKLLRTPAVLCGTVGYVGRGVTVGLVGAFLLRAAVAFDRDQAQGLDAALQAVVEQPYGRGLLALTVLGMLAYALWSLIEAAFRDI